MGAFILLKLAWLLQLTVNFTGALTCFNCQGIHHPRFCEYVKDCTDGEVCGLERKVESNGAVIFNTGCISPSTCSTNPNTINGVQACFRCCSNNLCNNFGCGEADFGVNGTLCYNCQGVLQPRDCQVVTFCENYEMCYIEERSYFGEKFYHSGCKEKHICDYQLVSGPIVGKRETIQQRSTTQLLCCNTGLCNNADHFILPTRPTITSNTDMTTTPGISSCKEKQTCFNGASCHTLNEKLYCTCAEGYLGENCLYSDGKDTNFVIIFHEIYRQGETSYITPKLLVASERPVHLSVYYFLDHKNQSIITDKKHPEYNLDKSVIMQDGMHHAGIEVHSNISVTMYGFLFQRINSVSEGLIAIPKRFLSREFVVPTFTTYEEYSVIAITPLFDSTIVEISIKIQSGTVTYDGKNYSNGDKIQLTLEKYNTFQLSHNSDLSGTMVTASMPVVVVSGNTLNHVLPNRIGDAQPYMEMVLPTDQLDHLYVIPCMSTRPKSVVRIQTVNATSLVIRNDNKILTVTNPRDHVDFNHTTISYIESSSDILVIIYPQSLPDRTADSFMMTIPGVNQYLPSYDFIVPEGFNSFISITVISGGVDGIILDGQLLNIQSVYSISEGSGHFSTFSLQVTSGFHHIEHNRNVRFGLWIYGSAIPVDAYGYPAGIAFKSLN